MNDHKTVAAITGASSGIGAKYAQRLAARGHDLILIARRTDRLLALAADLKERHGTTTDVITADLSDESDLARVEEALAARTDIGILVNNAGISKFAPFASQSQADISNTLSVNVVALTRIARAVAPGFIARADGVIINIASTLSVGAISNFAVYVASKAYVHSLSVVLQQELAGHGVKVQCVMPSLTATEIFDTMGLSPSDLPADEVMTVDDLVDAALLGLDRNELITMPSLADVKLLSNFDEARKALLAGSASGKPASRYAAKADWFAETG